MKSTRVRTKVRPSKMRDLILLRLSRLPMSRYELAKAVAGKVSQQAVYGFLAGKRDMTSGLVIHLLEACGLEIRPKE